MLEQNLFWHLSRLMTVLGYKYVITIEFSIEQSVLRGGGNKKKPGSHEWDFKFMNRICIEKCNIILLS